jgi:DNA polymerase-3 subunit delta'
MPLIPLYGHDTVRARLHREILQGSLPSSILLHGARGIGKQRLALWLAQTLLCEVDERPCGVCHACRRVLGLHHPDLYWFYPRPRLKIPDPSAVDVLQDYAESHEERLERHGLYAPPSGTEGIYIAAVRTIVHRAGIAPAIAHRKVFVVGDAERMVSQEGADQAANAFLKLLEEPPQDTTLILTSSEPGALLPTIRSRVVAVRCAPLSENAVRDFLENTDVRAVLDTLDIPKREDDRVALAGGAPGNLLAGDAIASALDAARELLRAAERRDESQYVAALSQGVSNARGAFSDTLQALNVLLHDRVRDALARGDQRMAYGASKGIDAVAEAQARSEGNVNPQLVAAGLLRALSKVLLA